jgi:serine/threonine-protein kinase
MPFHCIRCKTPIDKNFKACPHCGEPVTDFLRRYVEEPIDGKYEIVDRLGAGGMGDVYKVRHTYLNALRVVKVIRAQVSDSKEAHDRFLREAQVATKVQHPNVATLHDFSALPDGSHYMVWEFIEGENLAQRLKARGTLPPRQAVQFAIQTLHGLDAIHRAGIVHRDVSPENLMVTRDDHGEERIKIIDLGVAKIEEAMENVTRTGVFVGKFRYASPEHLGFLQEGERIDGRADLYSLAIVLYEMLSGRPPFEAKSPHEYILLHSRDTAFRPTGIPAGLPGGRELERILEKALDRDRDKRYANASELANALEEVGRSFPDPRLEETFRMPVSGGATLRLAEADTLHRVTLRSEQATLQTPLPLPLPLPIPTPAPLPAEPRRVAPPPAPRSKVAVAAFVLAMLAVLTAAGFGLIRFFRPSVTTQQAGETQQIASGEPSSPPAPKSGTVPPAPAGQTLDVVASETGTATAPEPSPTPSVSTTQSSSTRPPATRSGEKPPAEPPKQEPPKRAEPVNVRTYVENGDSDANEAALEELRRQLSGVTAVALEGIDDSRQTKEISAAIEETRTVSADASVVIRFRGTLERLGRGRKRRSAEATILKNGRPIFRYEMPPEEYRVGDSPAEAFARVLRDALEE